MNLLFALWLWLFAQNAAPPAPPKPNAADLEKSVVKIVVLDSQGQMQSAGTGFFVGNGKIVATAAHVYLEAAKVIIDRGGGQIVIVKNSRSGKRFLAPVEFVTADYGHDLALLRFDPAIVKQQAPEFAIRALEVDDHKLDIGDAVMFYGYFGADEFPLLSRTTVAGFTSSPPSPEQIVLDLPANPGQSGGPVFSAESGKLVGVVASFVPAFLTPGSLPTHSGLSRSVEVVHLKRLIESADVR